MQARHWPWPRQAKAIVFEITWWRHMTTFCSHLPVLLPWLTHHFWHMLHLPRARTFNDWLRTEASGKKIRVAKGEESMAPTCLRFIAVMIRAAWYTNHLKPTHWHHLPLLFFQRKRESPGNKRMTAQATYLGWQCLQMSSQLLELVSD